MMSDAEERRQRPLKLRELSGLLGVHDNTMLKWAKDGTVRAFKVGQRWYVSADEADRLVGGPK